MKTGNGIPDLIFDALCNKDMINTCFPMLHRQGIPDVGITVHSHFLTLLSTVGHQLGFSAISECPITWSGDYSKFGNVRSDSVWFDRKSLAPRVIVEFERFEQGDEGKLRQKVENLSIASLASPTLDLALLIYWVRSGSAPRSMKSVINVYCNGFRRRGYNVPPATTPLMIVKCVMRIAVDCDFLLLGEFLRDRRNERLFLGRA